MRNALRTALTDDVCLLLDQFSRATGTRIVFFDAEGTLLKAGLDRPDCAYCQLIRQELYGPEMCQQADACGCESARGKGIHGYQCPAGLHEIVIPVYTGGCLLGYAMIGQIRTRSALPARVATDWATGSGGNKLKNAFYDLPLVPPDRLEALTRFVSLLVDSIVSNHMVQLQGDSCLVSAIEHMTRHLTEPLTLTQVAEAVQRSPGSLSRAFRTHLQTTFKAVLNEMKLARAEEWFIADPTLTIAEAASRLGYTDAFYFSRVYRQHRGEPPSDLLKRLRADTPS